MGRFLPDTRDGLSTQRIDPKGTRVSGVRQPSVLIFPGIQSMIWAGYDEEI